MQQLFFEHGRRVDRADRQRVQCADPRSHSAGIVCCDADKPAARWATGKCLFPSQLASAAAAQARCADSGKVLCAPTESTGAIETRWSESCGYRRTSPRSSLWTAHRCEQQVQIDEDGSVRVIHVAEGGERKEGSGNTTGKHTVTEGLDSANTFVVDWRREGDSSAETVSMQC